MSNEKMKILKMLEEGKINAQEASRLLESGKFESYKEENRSNDQGGARSASRPTGKTFDDYADDFNRKFSSLAGELEPKINKFAEKVVEKTVAVADKISETIASSDFSISKPSGRAAATEPRQFELKVSQGENQLDLRGLNGDVLVKGYNGDKISIKVYASATPYNAPISLSQYGNTYKLVYNENEFQKVSIDAFVPSNMFNHIKISTENGKVTLSDVVSKTGVIDNFNGQILINNAEIENLVTNSSNAPILFDIKKLNVFSDYNWKAETNNAKIELILPTSNQYGYDVEAHTSLGNIRLGLTNMQFFANNGYNIEARTIEYNKAMQKINLKLQTSGAQITIN